MKTQKIQFSYIVVLLLGLTINIYAQTTYVFHTISRSSLPITVTVNGHIYKLTRTCEYAKPNDGNCLTVNVPGNMTWTATDCDGDRMTKYERGQMTKDGCKVVYIRIIATTKIHKERNNSFRNNNSSYTDSNKTYSNSTSKGGFKRKLSDGLTGLATQVIGNLMNAPTLSESDFLISRAMKGDPESLDTYGRISFWGSQNTSQGAFYQDIPIDYRVTLNCLIQNNHNLRPYFNICYENDAEIGFMWGRGFGVEINLEEANSYFQQAYERDDDSIAPFNKYYANLAKADVLIRTAKKDTLEALDLIATAMNTSAENILNGNFPQSIMFKGYNPRDPFDCGYSYGGGGVSSLISLCSYIDLGNILWYGCKSFEPNKTAALEVFRRIKDANAKTDGLPHLQLSNALIDIYNRGYKEDVIIDLILESSTLGAQSLYQDYRSNCAYSLASLYMFVQPLRNLKKAEFYLKEAKKFKHPIMKEKVKNAYIELKRLKKEAKER